MSGAHTNVLLYKIVETHLNYGLLVKDVRVESRKLILTAQGKAGKL